MIRDENGKLTKEIKKLRRKQKIQRRLAENCEKEYSRQKKCLSKEDPERIRVKKEKALVERNRKRLLRDIRYCQRRRKSLRVLGYDSAVAETFDV